MSSSPGIDEKLRHRQDGTSSSFLRERERGGGTVVREIWKSTQYHIKIGAAVGKYSLVSIPLSPDCNESPTFLCLWSSQQPPPTRKPSSSPLLGFSGSWLSFVPQSPGSALTLQGPVEVMSLCPPLQASLTWANSPVNQGQLAQQLAFYLLN